MLLLPLENDASLDGESYGLLTRRREILGNSLIEKNKIEYESAGTIMSSLSLWATEAQGVV